MTKDGYKPFTGPVLVFRANGEAFSVWLCPVQMAPISSNYQSYSDLKCELGKIDSIELSNLTPEPKEKVQVTVTCSNLPNMPGERSSILCGVGKADFKLRMQTKENITTFSGDITMPSTNKRQPNVSGLHTLFFSIKPCYQTYSWINRDNFKISNINDIRQVAIGVDKSKQQDVAAELAKLNQRPIVLSEAEKGKATEVILSAIPTKAPEAAAVQTAAALTDEANKAETFFINGDYKSAWKPWARTYANYEPGSPVLCIYRSAFLITENKKIYEAYASLNAAVKKEYKVNDKIGFQKAMDALPAMPAAITPQDKYDAASALFVAEKNEEAVAYLESISEDKRLGADAQLALATYYCNMGDENKAAEWYAKAFASRKDKVPGFYPNYNYGKILLKRSEREAACRIFEQALAQARNTYSAISDPVAPIRLPTGPNKFQTYTMFTGPLCSYTVGYAYAEASSLQLILSCYNAFEKPEEDWLSTATLGKSLNEIGLPELASPMLKVVAERYPDQQYVLAPYATAVYTAGDKANAAKLLDQLLALNPRNPEGLKLAEMAKAQPKN